MRSCVFRRLPRILAFITAIGVTVHLSGCAAPVMAAAGATAGFGLAQDQASSYISGEMKAARLVSLDQAVTATVAAMNELQMELRTERRRTYRAAVKAKAKGGPTVKIDLEAKSPTVTKFEIRVGIMGDHAVSQLVLARIDAKLEEMIALPAKNPDNDRVETPVDHAAK